MTVETCEVSPNIHNKAKAFPHCVKIWTMFFLQVRDRLLSRKVTGPAGLAGPAARGGRAPGYATAIRTGLLELRAEEAEQAKNTARQINDHSTTNLYLSNTPMCN